MHGVWLLLGIALALTGCSSPSSETPSASTSVAAGNAGPQPAGRTAAGSGVSAGTAPTAGSLGIGAAGRSSTQSPAGRGSAPQAGTSAPQAGAGQAAPAGSSAQADPNTPQAGAGQAAAAGSSARAGASAGASGAPAAGGGGAPATTDALPHFSFFVTSFAGMQKLSGKQEGFGGDLRYGQADGLAGADKICSDLAEASLPGASSKGWRAFLSVAQGPDGAPVHAIDRIGEGPWYDRVGRLVAMDKAALLNARPRGADPAIVNDLPNEDGVPNQRPDPNQPPVNNHHILTGSDTSGRLYNNSVNSTCANWTSAASNAGRPRIGYSYPAGNRQHWISGQDEGGCGAGAVLVDRGGSDPSNPIVGSGGGYGGIYCFAQKP